MTRLVLHDADPSKEYWDRVVLFVSKDENLTKAHARYLEARLIQLATAARRCTVDNKTAPVGGSLPEADIAEMDDFIEQVRILLSTFNVDVFEPAPIRAVERQALAETQSTEVELVFRGEGYDARCDLRDGEFVVLQGSVARTREVPSLNPSAKIARAQLISTGVMTESSAGYVFTQDYAFASPSGAAQVILGASINGRDAWKTTDGTSFGTWQERALSLANV